MKEMKNLQRDSVDLSDHGEKPASHALHAAPRHGAARARLPAGAACRRHPRPVAGRARRGAPDNGCDFRHHAPAVPLWQPRKVTPPA